MHGGIVRNITTEAGVGNVCVWLTMEDLLKSFKETLRNENGRE